MNLAEIRQRIVSISQTRQITQAMRMISSAKMRQGLKRATSNDYYIQSVRTAIRSLLTTVSSMEHRYVDRAKSGRAAFVVITSERGLAGGYNNNILKFAEEYMSTYQMERVYTIGAVAHEYFAHKHVDHNADFLRAIDHPELYEARKLSYELLRLFNQKQVDQVFIFYTHLINSMTCEPRVLRLLPLRQSDFPEIELPSQLFPGSFLFEPDPQTVLENLVPQYVVGQVYATLIQAFASEQCARMAAMDAATNNADEMLHTLNLQYNRARQDAITQEITEIMGGMAAGGE